jgi:hypothetical protein
VTPAVAAWPLRQVTLPDPQLHWRPACPSFVKF